MLQMILRVRYTKWIESQEVVLGLSGWLICINVLCLVLSISICKHISNYRMWVIDLRSLNLRKVYGKSMESLQRDYLIMLGYVEFGCCLNGDGETCFSMHYFGVWLLFHKQTNTCRACLLVATSQDPYPMPKGVSR